MAEDSLLLDTTFLLPLFGLESGLPNFNDSFRRLLSSYEVRYHPISLLEAKWLVLRLARGAKEDKLGTFLSYYREGIGAITKEVSLQQTSFTNQDVEVLSDRLLIEAGHKDYFDRQIYSTAACSNYLFLTEDERLHKLSRTLQRKKPKSLLRWKDVLRLLSK